MSTQAQPSAAVGTGQSIWEDARSLLSEDVAEIFELDRTEKKDCNQLLEEILKITDRKKTEFIERGTKFSFRGKTIVVRDVLSKLVVWIDRFKAFGDTATQIDTLHAALPWVAVRFLLDAAVRDERTYSSTLAGVARIAKIYTLTFIIERLYLSMHSDIVKHLRQSLVELYAEMILLLSKSVRYFDSGKLKRAVKGIFSTEDIEDSFDSLEAKQREVERIIVLAEADRVQAMSNVTQEIRAQQEQLKSKLEEFAKPLGKIEAQFIDIYNYVDEDRQVKILDSISEILHNSHHDFAAKGRLPGSGEWLFKRPEFQSWQEATSSSIIWLRGDPGAGKTKLASLVVDKLRTKEELGNEREPRNERFAFFYCNRNPAQPERAHAEPILASLVRQLACVAEGVIFDTIRSRYSKILKSGTHRDVTWPTEKSVHALIGLTSLHTSTVLVLDALDEVEPSEIVTLLAALLNVKRNTAGTVKIFFSSRQNERIKDHLQDHPNFCIEAHDNTQDIEAFVRTSLESFTLLKKLPSLQETALWTLTDGAQGMFRWVELQIQMLQELQDPEDFEERLGNLPESLEDSYLEIYSKIQRSSNKNAAKFATRTFQWLLVAKKELDLEQFAILASIDSKNPAFYNADYFLDICQNLISRDNDGNFRFAHLSVREFFEQSMPKREIEAFLPPQANASIASLCLINLSLIDISNADDAYRSLYAYREFETRVPERSLSALEYAVFYWADHICCDRCCTLTDSLKTQIMDFMVDEAQISPRFRFWTECFGRFDSQNFGKTTREVRLAEHPIWALDAFNMIEEGEFKMPEINAEEQRIVLEVAISTRNLSMMERMLQTGLYLDCMSEDQPNTAAIQESTTAPPSTSCRACIEKESLTQAINSIQNWREVLKKWAVQLFLTMQEIWLSDMFETYHYFHFQWRPDLSSRQNSAERIREVATSIQTGMDVMLRILNDHDADVERMALVDYLSTCLLDFSQLVFRFVFGHAKREPHLRNTVLHECAKNGALDIVEALLTNGAAQINARNRAGCTPLHEANDPSIIRILLEHGAQINARNRSGDTVLHYGVNDPSIVRMLLDHGAQVNAQDDAGETPLHRAIIVSPSEVIQALLSGGAQVDARDIDSATPLHYLVLYSNEVDKVQMLLDYGAPVSARAKGWCTPLHAAIDLGHIPILQILLDHGADVEEKDENDWTPLHCAALLGRIGAVKLFIAYGADIESEDKDNLKPRDVAERGLMGTESDNGRIEVVKYLADFKNLPIDQRPKRSDYEPSNALLAISQGSNSNKLNGGKTDSGEANAGEANAGEANAGEANAGGANAGGANSRN